MRLAHLFLAEETVPTARVGEFIFIDQSAAIWCTTPRLTRLHHVPPCVVARAGPPQPLKVCTNAGRQVSNQGHGLA